MTAEIKERKISDKIIRNTAYNIMGRSWIILLGLILTPYIITHIGLERYGIWAIVTAITGYFGLFDFGINTSFAKYIAEFYAKEDHQNINRIVNTGMVFYFIFAIICTLFAILIANFLLMFFKVPSPLYEEALFVFLLSIITFGVINISSVFSGIQYGLQRMDIANKISIWMSLPTIIGTILFLEMGYGLPGLMINNLIIFTGSSVINLIIGFKLLPELKLKLYLFNRDTFKMLFNYGYKLQISRLAQLISFQTDKLLIARFLALDLVTPYQLGSKITSMMRELPLLLVSALMPAVSEIDAKIGRDALNRLYLKGTKYLILVSTPLLFFTVLNAPLIILAWVGKGYEKAVLATQILAIGYYANLVSGVASSIAAGVGKTEFEMKYGIFMSILNLSSSILLIITIGFAGAVIGTSISLSIASFYFLWMFHKYLGRPLSEFFTLFYKPLFACLLPVMLSYLLNYAVQSNLVGHIDRFYNLGLLALNGVIFLSIYTISILLVGYFDEYDKGLLKEKVPYLKNRL